MKTRHEGPAASPAPEGGFSIVEFLVSTLVLLAISAATFTMLARTQRASVYQTEVQAVLENSRIAMETAERLIRQAGNDPLNTGFAGVTITDATHVRLRSDLTGAAAGNPDKGDPDGDTNDSGEDVTLQYNSGTSSVEIVPNGGSAQPIANYITNFSMQYFDANGTATSDGTAVRRVRISLTAGTTLAHPQTGKTYSLQVASDVQLTTRQ
jgi:type II secretory pathway pseudopilin PulG